MSWQDRIVVDPNVMVGKPVVRGTRLTVEFIIGLLAQGWNETDILENYPLPGNPGRQGLSALRGRVAPVGEGLPH